jgi:hypothetical protein
VAYLCQYGAQLIFAKAITGGLLLPKPYTPKGEGID